MNTSSAPTASDYRDSHVTRLDRLWRAGLAAVVEMAARLGRDPSQKSKDPQERTVGVWLGTQRKLAGRGTLLPWRAAELGAAA